MVTKVTKQPFKNLPQEATIDSRESGPVFSHIMEIGSTVEIVSYGSDNAYGLLFDCAIKSGTRQWVNPLCLRTGSILMSDYLFIYGEENL